jgi:hypothetical protein
MGGWKGIASRFGPPSSFCFPLVILPPFSPFFFLLEPEMETNQEFLCMHGIGSGNGYFVESRHVFFL